MLQVPSGIVMWGRPPQSPLVCVCVGRHCLPHGHHHMDRNLAAQVQVKGFTVYPYAHAIQLGRIGYARRCSANGTAARTPCNLQYTYNRGRAHDRSALRGTLVVLAHPRYGATVLMAPPCISRGVSKPCFRRETVVYSIRIWLRSEQAAACESRRVRITASYVSSSRRAGMESLYDKGQGALAVWRPGRNGFHPTLCRVSERVSRWPVGVGQLVGM
ncbi:uncharacterized protein LY79DRAFT_294750 [Colletotrichum navitas]|uniref:Uncharacterized protein n=1 Tax=Colletotrichum navitas TaxID=681940 RepID=A0AAD8PVQ6_9PEZI|nr:uncharacterized protein LY79DRAFT_294750 [Colletotrichum navitas]KAK1584774.1 hypothetical protein LY79DRAFT_294750 [Colletotrichum navitas]